MREDNCLPQEFWVANTNEASITSCGRERQHDQQHRAGLRFRRGLRRPVGPLRHQLRAGEHGRPLRDPHGQAGGGIKLLITDCEDTLSPVQWHLDGRAAGFYVGVYRAELDADGVYVDFPNQFAWAYSETAPPTAEAIGDLVQEALENATHQPGKHLHYQIAKGDRRARDRGC